MQWALQEVKREAREEYERCVSRQQRTTAERAGQGREAVTGRRASVSLSVAVQPSEEVVSLLWAPGGRRPRAVGVPTAGFLIVSAWRGHEVRL